MSETSSLYERINNNNKNKPYPPQMVMNSLHAAKKERRACAHHVTRFKDASQITSQGREEESGRMRGTAKRRSYPGNAVSNPHVPPADSRDRSHIRKHFEISE